MEPTTHHVHQIVLSSIRMAVLQNARRELR